MAVMAALECYWTDDNINKLVENRIARDTNFKQTNSDRLGWIQVVSDLKKEGGIKALNRINVQKQWFAICELYKKSLNPEEEIVRHSLKNKPYYDKLKQFFDKSKSSAKSISMNQEFRKKLSDRLFRFSPYADRWSAQRTNALIEARIARHSMFKGRGYAALAWKTITEDVMLADDPVSEPLTVQQVKKKWDNLFTKYKAMYQSQVYNTNWQFFERMHYFYLEVCKPREVKKETCEAEEDTQIVNSRAVLADRWPASRTKLLIDRRIARASMFGRGISAKGWQAILDDLIKNGAPPNLSLTSVKKKWENLLTRHKFIKDSNMKQTKWPFFNQIEKYHNLKKTRRRTKKTYKEIKEETEEIQNEEVTAEEIQDEVTENLISSTEKLNKCRLCQQLEGDYSLIDDKILCDRIVQCTSINIYENMEILPTTICEICKDAVEKYYKFLSFCLDIDKKLRSDLEQIVIKTENNSYDSNRNEFDSQEEMIIPDTLECSECPASFSSTNALEIHLKSHKTSIKYHCEICNIGFSKQSSLYVHIEQHFDINKIERTDLSLENVEIEYLDITECNDLQYSEAENCDTVGENISKIIMTDDIFQCELCSKTFTSEIDLKNHLETHTKIEHRCAREDCNKKFTTLKSLRHHEMRHLGLNSFLCTICGKGFVTKNALKMHEKIHSEVKEHICEICSQGFSVLSNLRTHQKKHHEGHRFYCSQCPREFLTKSSLQRHELVHTGIKEFVCDVCSAAFFTLKELKKHKRYHENVRLYHCNVCFKTFFEKHHLTVHNRSHTGERPYSCTIPGCSKSFMEKQKLHRHEKTHHKLPQPI